MPPWIAQLIGGPIIQKLLDFIPDPAEKAKQQFELQQAIMVEAAKADSDQRDINKTEAASASMFVAGWRPACGWLCVVTLGYSWVLTPMLTWGLTAAGLHVPALPTLGTEESQTLLYALLGIGGLRTVDKVMGADTKGISGVISTAVGKIAKR